MPGLMTLTRHAAADGLFLLGHEHHAESAFADLLQQLVRADRCPRPLGDGLQGAGALTVEGRPIEEAACIAVCLQ